MIRPFDWGVAAGIAVPEPDPLLRIGHNHPPPDERDAEIARLKAQIEAIREDVMVKGIVAWCRLSPSVFLALSIPPGRGIGSRQGRIWK